MNRSLDNSDRRDCAGAAWRIALGLAIVAGLALWGYAAGPGSPWFAVGTGFTLLGLLDLLRYFVRLSPPLRGIRPGEGRSAWYRYLGVRAFGALLRRSPLQLLNRRVYRLAARDGNQLLRELAEAEAAHTIAFVLVGLYLGFATAQGWWSAVAGLAVLNLAANLYPILHLRLARGRVAAFVARAARCDPRRAGGS